MSTTINGVTFNKEITQEQIEFVQKTTFSLTYFVFGFVFIDFSKINFFATFKL